MCLRFVFFLITRMVAGMRLAPRGDVEDRRDFASASPVGFQNCATGLDLGFLGDPLVFLEETAEDGLPVDRVGEAEMATADGVVGSRPDDAARYPRHR
jgi:hypothetical protein